MEQMKEKEIVKFLKENVEPIEHYSYGNGYRAAVYLVDGTFLPCVIFYNSKTRVELAKRRFEEGQSGKFKFNTSWELGYLEIIKSFVASGNRISAYDIGKIEKSKFAFPLSILYQIDGETSMGWTGFVVKMKDGKCYSFGTTFSMEFFNLPDKYSVEDIDEIINHSYVLKTGEIRSSHTSYASSDKSNNEVIYRERPYFECFLDNL